MMIETEVEAAIAQLDGLVRLAIQYQEFAVAADALKTWGRLLAALLAHGWARSPDPAPMMHPAEVSGVTICTPPRE